MLHLKTAAGERLEIPAACILAVMRPCDGGSPSSIIYDEGAGVVVDQLNDPYGFVKTAVVHSGGMVNPLEVRIVEATVLGLDANGRQVLGAPYQEGRAFFARSHIKGRREIFNDPNGIRARLTVDLLGSPSTITIADSLDELDGVEADAPAAPVAPLIAPPQPPEGA